jgi:acyl-coenzyme A synthetase/AMP-(fatty) acid ligase
MMKALSFDPGRHPTIKHLSLSGGALAPEGMRWLIELSRQGVSIYSMYGQTEAGGRMSVLPPEMLESKAGSVGYAVEGGMLRCDAEGNIHFQGPNVMLGYAKDRVDLTSTDQQGGSLQTGDKGFMDHDGCLTITGRTSRIAKLFGLRIELDEIEAFLGGTGTVAATCNGQTLDLFVERRGFADFAKRSEELLRRLQLPSHCVRTQVLADIPRTENGKIHYSELQSSRVTDVA